MSRTDSDLDTELAGVLLAALRGLPRPTQPLDPDALAARLADLQEPDHEHQRQP